MINLTTLNFYTFRSRGGVYGVGLNNVEITNSDTIESICIESISKKDLNSIADAITILSNFADDGDCRSIELYKPDRIDTLKLYLNSSGIISVEFLIDAEDESALASDGYEHYHCITDILEYSGCKDYKALSDMLKYLAQEV